MLYSELKQKIKERTARSGELEIIVPASLFKRIVEGALGAVEVDEEWYLAEYADVRSAIKLGTINSAKHHYVTHGYFENRLPRPVTVDPEFYLKANPDVAGAIKGGAVESAGRHFVDSGRHEGRAPSKDFKLF